MIKTCSVAFTDTCFYEMGLRKHGFFVQLQKASQTMNLTLVNHLLIHLSLHSADGSRFQRFFQRCQRQGLIEVSAAGLPEFSESCKASRSSSMPP